MDQVFIYCCIYDAYHLYKKYLLNEWKNKLGQFCKQFLCYLNFIAVSNCNNIEMIQILLWNIFFSYRCLENLLILQGSACLILNLPSPLIEMVSLLFWPCRTPCTSLIPTNCTHYFVAACSLTKDFVEILSFWLLYLGHLT